MLSPPNILWICVIFLYQGMQADGGTMPRYVVSHKNVATTTNKYIKVYSEPVKFDSVVKGPKAELTNNVLTATRTNNVYSEPVKFDSVVKGPRAELSNNALTATRTNPLENSGFSGVVTQRPLNDGEMFMIRIDQTPYDSDYGVAFGLTKMPPNTEIPEKFIFHREGTWSIYSSHGQDPGYSCLIKDNQVISTTYPLETRYLPVGSTLGVRRMENGTVHFFVNGIDKGVAYNNVPNDVHGFVDVINYVSEVTIINQ